MPEQQNRFKQIQNKHVSLTRKYLTTLTPAHKKVEGLVRACFRPFNAICVIQLGLHIAPPMLRKGSRCCPKHGVALDVALN